MYAVACCYLPSQQSIRFRPKSGGPCLLILTLFDCHGISTGCNH